jgi:hypothetical protein
MPNAPQEKVQFHTGAIPLQLLSFLLTIVVAVGSGYGGARFQAGKQEEKNADFQRQIDEMKAEAGKKASKEQAEFIIKTLDEIKAAQVEVNKNLWALRQESKR